MAIFDTEHYGNKISESMRVIIKANKGSLDLEGIAKKHGYTFQTLEKILTGARNLTKNNAPMITEVFKQCLTKSIEQIAKVSK
jgi:hypothetical protein